MDESSVLSHYLLSRCPDGVMVDVGAHHGGACSVLLERGWQVYAFEPDAENREHLRHLGARHDRLHIDSRAVSDTETEGASFYRSPLSSGISSLSPFHSSHVEAGSVSVTTLRRFCEEQRVERVDFLKVDTEGHDLFVLKGFPWESLQPAVVLCEFEDRKTTGLGYGAADLGHLLAEKGYKVLISEWHPIVAYGQTHRWSRFMEFPDYIPSGDSWGNMIAFRKDVDWLCLCNALVAGLAPSARLEEAAAEAEARLAYMRRSWSWRLTHPLRLALKALKLVTGRTAGPRS